MLYNLGLTSIEPEPGCEYLIIAPSAFLPAYTELIDWRWRQGYNARIQTIEWINANCEGIDLQDRVRNYIIDRVENYGTEFVTLGADVEYIPDRKLFAFDCEAGHYVDENEIPGDMYYSCLDGDWDANGNGVYGEDYDLPDYLPEVFVSRIPANSIEDVTSYCQRVINYESRSLTPGVPDDSMDFNTAIGFSMELWTGSNSEVCQQFIYDNYFPDYYDITFLFNDANHEFSAITLLSHNPNIV
ncbi:MAG: hypothetical protein K8S56_02130, partial [Candidatus Cloacimonetes bacterium]|nr:hypothetical protein [Candidatus Cloacimonadota bacterium]